MDKKKVTKYLALVYIMAWSVEIIGSLIYRIVGGMKGLTIFHGFLALTMFMPILAAFFVKADFKVMGWKPRFKGNVKWIVFSMVMPTVASILGFVCFFTVFPKLFSMDLSYFMNYVEGMGQDSDKILESMLQSGLSKNGIIAVTVLQCVLEAPLINTFTAIGEEAGWRGFLYPELRKSYGRVKTWITGGIIWAAFHYPAMLIGGYEYGDNYIGKPVLGILAFTIFCIIVGVLEEIIYDRTKCIWYPSLLHGGINASITLYMMVLNGDYMSEIERVAVFGPGYNGLISMIPIMIIAVVVALMTRKRKDA